MGYWWYNGDKGTTIIRICLNGFLHMIYILVPVPSITARKCARIVQYMTVYVDWPAMNRRYEATFMNVIRDWFPAHKDVWPSRSSLYVWCMGLVAHRVVELLLPYWPLCVWSDSYLGWLNHSILWLNMVSLLGPEQCPYQMLLNIIVIC